MPRSKLAKTLCLLAVWAAASLAYAEATPAVVNDAKPEVVHCPLYVYDFTLQTNPVVNGLAVAGSSVQIDATDALLIGSHSLRGGGECETLAFQIPHFKWEFVETPPETPASIAHGDTLSPTINLGRGGPYRVRFTACPDTCKLVKSGKSKVVGPMTTDVPIQADSFAPIQPETLPSLPHLLPPKPALPTFDDSTRATRCSNGGGFHNPEWVTTQPFNGSSDYRRAEGQVNWSHVSEEDNFLNHSSGDFEWRIYPDAPYTGLQSSESSLKTEWEKNSLPTRYWPTPPPDSDRTTLGDRVSEVGFWIFDCGHSGFKTEIHPPVGMAVERPRPVQIPPDFKPDGYPNGLGSNIWVPGITTDIWFNRDSGGIGRCGETGLHQPAGTSSSGCIVQPHPLDRQFVFNIYLPRSPQQPAAEHGITAPDVPLYIGTTGQGGPQPTITREGFGGHTWLHVTVDLSGFSGGTYSRRISAAWAYPQPGNWGATRWRVSLDSIDVNNSADPFSGDWRFFFNTNNVNQEWTNVFSCDGCIESHKTYQLGARTGGGGGDGSGPGQARALGPDPVVFPGQPIIVHTSGYDEDALVGDPLDTVLRGMPQARGHFSEPGQGGDGTYVLNYSLDPQGSVGPATLTPEANQLLMQYTAGSGSQCNPPTPDATGRIPQECTPKTFSPLGTSTFRALRTLAVYDLNEAEEQALTGISASHARREFKSMGDKARERLVKAVRHHLQALPKKLRPDSLDLVLTMEKFLPKAWAHKAIPTKFHKLVAKLEKKIHHG